MDHLSGLRPPKVIAPKHSGDTRTEALGASCRWRASREGRFDMFSMTRGLERVSILLGRVESRIGRVEVKKVSLPKRMMTIVTISLALMRKAEAKGSLQKMQIGFLDLNWIWREVKSLCTSEVLFYTLKSESILQKSVNVGIVGVTVGEQ